MFMCKEFEPDSKNLESFIQFYIKQYIFHTFPFLNSLLNNKENLLSCLQLLFFLLSYQNILSSWTFLFKKNFEIPSK
jgi:hypothetical protein